MPLPDTFEDGKRVTALETIFEQLTRREQRAVQQLRSLDVRQLSPAKALKALCELKDLLDGDRKAG